MFLDDTDTVANVSVELVIFGSGEIRESNETLEWPGMQIARGVQDDLEINFEISRQVTEGEPVFPESGTEDELETSGRETGLGNAVVGVKWRMLEERELSVAVSPSYSFPLEPFAQIRGLVEDARVLDLPFIVAWATGRWQLRGQLGYAWVSGETDSLTYGTSLSFSPVEQVSLHAEVYGFEFDDETAFANWRVGIEWSISDGVDALAAYGGALKSDLSDEDRLDEDFFLGMLFRF
jgi:hypothetical protein